MKPDDLITPHMRNIPPSGIRKYFDMINEMKDAISLGVGEPDFVTPWNIREAGIYSLEKGHTHYSSNAGLIELRVEISNYLERKYDLKYNPESQIIVTVGGSEGIDLALRMLVSRGDEVIIPEPSFVAYKGGTLMAGGTPVIINLKEKNEFRLTPEELEAAITDRTKALIISYPNNPTGAVMSKDDLAKLVEVLKDRDIVVISDEMYSELNYRDKHYSIANFPEMKDKTIVINGFSKAFAMTGWRLGYICGHPVFIDVMKKIHQYALMCPPTTSQYAALEALRSSEEDVQMMVREYNRRRRLMVEGFRRIGLECFEPYGAFYVFPCLKSIGMSSDEFCENLLREEKVLIVPGTAFGECGEGFFRATYATSLENITEALKRIQRFVEKRKKQEEQRCINL
jgi:aminotransferase